MHSASITICDQVVCCLKRRCSTSRPLPSSNRGSCASVDAFLSSSIPGLVGFPNRKPWAWLHPSFFRKSRSAAVSTPSARTSMLSARPRAMVDFRIACDCAEVVMLRMNVLSILILSMGKVWSVDSDEYPVPKSSIAIETPIDFNSRTIFLACHDPCSKPRMIPSFDPGRGLPTL